TLAKKRYVEVVSQVRRRWECPNCHRRGVKRESVGIWLCKKCGFKFAGGAYVPTTKLGEVAKRSMAKEPVEEGLLVKLERKKAKKGRKGRLKAST
ncbi:TPA: hypothetical protein EYP26_03230, partial [Candidatus Bathyarchaeota archaeon]|nr:hypothetical protein [Candidatus Bathyarchaeota archaeon]